MSDTRQDPAPPSEPAPAPPPPMTWQEKGAELLPQIEARVEAEDWRWLRHGIDLDCPELEDWDTEAMLARFSHKGKLNKARLTRTYVWQAWLKVQVGAIEQVHGNVRSFWYQYLEGFFRSHGLFGGTAPDPGDDFGAPHIPYLETPLQAVHELLNSRGPLSEHKVEAAMCDIFTEFVDHHIFRYQGEFGFSESLQSKYTLGRDRAKYLFYTEKMGLWPFCETINKTTIKGRSITVMASHGEVSYQKVESLADQLKDLSVGEVVVGAMVDYDPWGLWIAWNMDHKLSSMVHLDQKDENGKLKPYFRRVTTYLLTTSDLFTPAQVKKAGRDLSHYPDQKLVQTWMAVTHGIHGKPIAMHVDVVSEALRRQRVNNWLDDMVDHIPCPYPTVPKIPPKVIIQGPLPIGGFDAFTTDGG